MWAGGSGEIAMMAVQGSHHRLILVDESRNENSWCVNGATAWSPSLRRLRLSLLFYCLSLCVVVVDSDTIKGMETVMVINYVFTHMCNVYCPVFFSLFVCYSTYC